tara:strand:- start:936 stop:1316 length:381 start_codon:yes stop_codon:yes gene_type:complete
MALNRGNLEKLELLAGVATGEKTATGNGSSVDFKGYEGDILFILDSAAGGGSSPTLDVTIEDSADNSTFGALSGAAFSQVTGTASVQKLSISADECKRYIRVKYTIGGSSPTFTFSVNGLGLKKYG